VVLVMFALPGVSSPQDLEPRRWAHFPVGSHVAGLTYVYTEGDVFFDPVLQLQDVQVQSHAVVASYAHWFPVLGKTGRIDAILPFQNAQWDGLLSGAPASTERTGLSDPWIRLSVDLVGAPALKGEPYQAYRAARPVHTVAGVALGVMLPLGEYQPERLLNLGQNRFVIRPQAGVVHTRGPWSYELTGSVFLFTDNDDFFGGNQREQDPLGTLQAHVVRTFPRRWWASAGAGYSWGGESTINGVRKGDHRSYLLSGLSLGFPVGQAQALKLAYLRGDTQTDVGSDSDSVLVSWSLRF
jgi:hypothetical protein